MRFFQRSAKKKSGKKNNKIINTVNIFPAKIYFRVNILELKFATQKYSTNKEVVSVRFCNRMTKKSNLFYSFYTGYAKRSVVLKYVFPLQVLKKKNGRKYYQWFVRHFLSFFCKIISPSKKNQPVLNAKISSWKIQKNHVNRQSSKINFRKTFRATR